jgi:hypothetical protein
MGGIIAGARKGRKCKPRRMMLEHPEIVSRYAKSKEQVRGSALMRHRQGDHVRHEDWHLDQNSRQNGENGLPINAAAGGAWSDVCR